MDSVDWRENIHDDHKHRSCPNLHWGQRERGCGKHGHVIRDADETCIDSLGISASSESKAVAKLARFTKDGVHTTDGSIGFSVEETQGTGIPDGRVDHDSAKIGTIRDFGQHVGRGEIVDCINNQGVEIKEKNIDC